MILKLTSTQTADPFYINSLQIISMRRIKDYT